MQASLKEGSATRILPYLPAQFNGAVKSGTNYDFADASIFGYTSSLTCGVWIGYLNDRQAMYQEAFASDVCGPVLGEVLRAAVGQYEDRPLFPPPDVETVEICKHSGQVATNFCYESVTANGKPSYTRPTYVEYFPKGDVTLSSCSVHGDGSPSLRDLLDNRGQNVFSRVLPIAPVLPQGLALIGQDPYGCSLALNPKYRGMQAEEAAAPVAEEQDALPADETSDSAERTQINTDIELRMPLPLRYLPTMPLQL